MQSKWLANPSLFLVYKNFNDRLNAPTVHGMGHRTAADAAALDAGADFSAHQGAVTVPNGMGEPNGSITRSTDDTWRTFDGR